MESAEYEIMFHAEERHWWYAALRAMLMQFWRANVPVERPRLLDVGCGSGANLKALSPMSNAIGIDISPKAVHFCRERGLQNTAVSSALALPFPNDEFDVVLLMDVLYHKAVPCKRTLLTEVGRVLKPGGVLLLNVPAYQWLYSSHDEAIHTDKRFTRREITDLLHEAGFTVSRATYWNTLLFPPIAATRLWRKLVPPEGSDLDNPSGKTMGRLFAGIFALERAFIKMTSLPFGLSIFAAANKPRE
jgi:SAM-dependent methyltransferase